MQHLMYLPTAAHMHDLCFTLELQTPMQKFEKTSYLLLFPYLCDLKNAKTSFNTDRENTNIRKL